MHPQKSNAGNIKPIQILAGILLVAFAIAFATCDSASEHALKGQACLEKQDWACAESEFSDCLNADSKAADCFAGLGDAAFELGHCKDALWAYSGYEELTGNEVPAFRKLGCREGR